MMCSYVCVSCFKLSLRITGQTWPVVLVWQKVAHNYRGAYVIFYSLMLHSLERSN